MYILFVTDGQLVTVGVLIVHSWRYELGIKERREREKKIRESQIIDAAEAVFFSKGFEFSTMDDVARQAELSKGALYLYFKGKKELCLAIIARSLSIVLSAFEKAAQEKTNGLGKFEKIAQAFLEFYKEYPNYYCAMLNYRNHRCACGDDSDALRCALDGNSMINKLFASIFELGLSDGSIREDIDPLLAARTVWGDMGGLIPGFILDENDKFSEVLFLNAMNMIKYGLKAK